MAQERLWNFKEEDSTELLNRRELGIFPAGRYRGFDYGTPAAPLTIHLVHNFTGWKYVDAALASHNNLGLLKTTQGVMVAEDAPVDLPISATTTNPRIDLVVFEHEFIEVEGGQEGVYLIKQGTAAPNPVAPVLDSPSKQIIIGQIYLPANTDNLSSDPGVIYTPAGVPQVSADPHIVYTNIEQVITELKFMKAIKLETGIATITLVSDTLVFDKKCNHWFLDDMALGNFEAGKIATINAGWPATAGYRMRVYTLQAIKFVATGNVRFDWTTVSGEKVVYIPAGTWFELEAMNGLTDNAGVYPEASQVWSLSMGGDAKTFYPNKFTKRQIFAKGLNAPVETIVAENTVLEFDNTGNFYDINVGAGTDRFYGGINGDLFQETLSTKYRAGGFMFLRIIIGAGGTCRFMHNSADLGGTKPITTPTGDTFQVYDGDLLILLEDETHWRIASYTGAGADVLSLIRNTLHTYTKMQTWGYTNSDTHAVVFNDRVRILNKSSNTYEVELPEDTTIKNIVFFDGVATETAIPNGTILNIKFVHAAGFTIPSNLESGTGSKIYPFDKVTASDPVVLNIANGETYTFVKVDSDKWELVNFSQSLLSTKVDKLQEAWRQVGGLGQPAYASIYWAGDVDGPLQFMKDSMGWVNIQGGVTAASAATYIICTLPTGYRPAMPVKFTVPYNQYHSGGFSGGDGHRTIRIDTSGVVMIWENALTWDFSVNYLDLSTIRFKAV